MRVKLFALLPAAVSLLLPFAASAEFPRHHTREVALYNGCDTTWEFLIMTSPAPDIWVRRGFYRLDPGEYTYPVRDGVRLKQIGRAHV